MKSIAALLFALSLALPGLARADSTGAPFLNGSWQGKIKAKIYDQTITGSLDKRFKYNSQVDVEIIQAQDSPDLIFSITYTSDALPVGTGDFDSMQTFTGKVGNSHMNIAGEDDDVFVVGSGAIDKKAKQIRMTGRMATSDYTIEFDMKLKRLND